MIPTETYDTLTAVHNNTYTAPANGWFSLQNSTGDTSLILVVNGVYVMRNWTHNYSGVIMPVYKGATVKVEFTGTPDWFRFVYARGSSQQNVIIKY